MILCFSTSSPWASVAAIDRESGVLWHGSEHAPQGASGACLALLSRMSAETNIVLEDAELFAADIGPGSFTGVRVGVTLAKTFGFLYGKPVAGATSFDLISVSQCVVLPSKKGEFFIRRPGQPPVRSVELPAEPYTGFGPDLANPTPPDAQNFICLLDHLEPRDAMSFVPEYLIEPSISIPKRPFASLGGASA